MEPPSLNPQRYPQPRPRELMDDSFPARGAGAPGRFLVRLALRPEAPAKDAPGVQCSRIVRQIQPYFTRSMPTSRCSVRRIAGVGPTMPVRLPIVTRVFVPEYRFRHLLCPNGRRMFPNRARRRRGEGRLCDRSIVQF